jgi:hypothetical protein
MVEFETSGDKLSFARDLIHLFQNRDDNIVASYSPSSGKPVPVVVEDLLASVYIHLFGLESQTNYPNGVRATGFYNNMISDHIFKATRIGVYSTDIESLTKWGMIDLDAGEDHKKQLVDIEGILIEIIHKAFQKGICIHVEVSGSGKGYHIWYFFEKKVPSSYVRELGQSLLPSTVEYLETETGNKIIKDGKSIEINPKSESYDSVGTMAWLPLYNSFNTKINNKFIDTDAFLKKSVVQDNFYSAYLNESPTDKSLRKFKRVYINKASPAKGDFMEIISGCTALKRLWNSDHIGHEERVILMSLALNTNNGQAILQGRWNSDKTEYHLQNAMKKNMRPCTCKTIQSYGVCRKGYDPLLGDHCFKKYKNSQNQLIEPSPIRLRSGARKVLSKIFLTGGKEMSC